MPPILIFLLIVVPIAELAVIIQVGQAIGVWWTIALLIGMSVLGAIVLRVQGRLAWRRFNEAIAEGRIPHREVVDGVLAIFAGVLLLTPGFITDVVGLVFLFPPTRRLARGLLVGRGALKVVGAMPGAASPPNGRMHRPDDIEGHAVDIDPESLPPR